MAWPNLGQWEWAIGEVIVLPLLFFELYRLRRSQRLDREKADRVTGALGNADREVTHPPDPSSPIDRR